MAERPHRPVTFHWSGYLLGFGLGGFFDGILLHQILQWHHLLSLVEGVGGITYQVLFDGLFHALMYVIAAVGLVLLWRGREALAAPNSGRQLLGSMLIGFGVWHIADSVLSHWVLGIHRIKLDSPNPLMWDLIWFAAFGLAPLLIGILLRGRGGTGARGVGGHAAAIGIILAVLIGAPWAAQTPSDSRTAMVIFAPSVSDREAWNAILASGGMVMSKSRGVWAIKWSAAPAAGALYRRGALIVSGSFLGTGCLAWSRS
jgi:uncharacterized membrane protein